MKESIMTIVVDNRDEEKELEIIYEDDTLLFVLDQQPLFSGDWTGNFFYIFNRALELWYKRDGRTG